MSDVIPVLVYRDANAAVDFLTSAFDAEEQEVFRDEGGEVVHAELRFGDDVVMVAQHQEGNRFAVTPGGAGIYVVREEVDEHFAQARDAGAEIVMEPTDQDYGGRDYIARDPEGNHWSFGTYRAG